ncbi:RNA exonuclease 4 [Peziza echinospora]|nr:RNA exonuclease 4 [Peziza echinospora]
MGKANKKRKNRGGNSSTKGRPNGQKSAAPPPQPPPLPSLDLPIFHLKGGDGAKHGNDEDGDHQDGDVNGNGNGNGDDAQQPLRKKLKKEKEHVPEVPEFCVSPTKLKRMVRVSDLQELVLWLLADGVAVQWLLVKRKQEIRKVVVVMVPGLDMPLLDGSVDLIGEPEVVPQQEEEDVGEVLTRNGDDGGPTEEDLEKAIAKTSVADDKSPEDEGEEGEIMEEDSAWTVVGSKKNPGATPFSFYPSLLAGRPLAPCLAELRNIFTHVWPTKTDGDDKTNKIHSPIAMFLNPALDKKNLPADIRNTFYGSNRIGITKLLMTPDQLFDNEYVLHSSSARQRRQARGGDEETADEKAERERLFADGWVETKVTGTEGDDFNEAGSTTEGRIIYSIDCEMCNTEVGQELTRISVIGWDGKIVYDTLVKPARPITDYLTQFSGITKVKLESITTTLADVQAHLLELFTPAHKVILIGQSLNSDLNALKLMHPYIIDTSLLYEHPRGRPYKASLKWLTYKYLKREIQKGTHLNPLTQKTEPGHDSIEDALACLDLVKLKLEKGLAFGNNEVKTESLFTRLERGHASQGNRHKLCWSAVVDHGNPSMVYGGVAKKVVACTTDREVVEGVKHVLGWKPEQLPQDPNIDPRARLAADGEVSFVWARLRELEMARGWDGNANKRQQQLQQEKQQDTDIPSLASDLPTLPTAPKDPPPAVLAEKVAETVARLKEMYASLPPNTAFIVYSGTGDPREMGRLNALQRRFREEYKTNNWDQLTVKWTDDEQQALNAAIKRTREGGLSFMTVKG